MGISCFSADIKTLGLIIGFSRIILISSFIPTNDYRSDSIISALVPLVFACCDICWVHGIYKERAKLLIPTMICVSMEICGLFIAAMAAMVFFFGGFTNASGHLIAIYFVALVTTAIDVFVWFVGYSLFHRLRETQGFKEADRNQEFA